MNYKVIDREKYYRKGVFRHFSEDCKCSTSMTAGLGDTDLAPLFRLQRGFSSPHAGLVGGYKVKAVQL